MVSRTSVLAHPRAVGAALAALALLLAFVVPPATPALAEDGPAAPWTATWGVAPHRLSDAGACAPCTIRNTIHTSIGGGSIRLLVNNSLGTTPLTITTMNVSLPAAPDSSASVPGSRVPVTFSDGDAGITLEPGAYATSDEVAMSVAADSDLQVTLFFAGDERLSYHNLGASNSNYVWRGSNVADDDAPPATTLVYPHTFTVSGLDVLPAPGMPAAAGTVVVFGDSITDGDGATTDPIQHANSRWSDHLADRLNLLPAQYQLGVVNAGIAGNRVLSDSGSAGRAAVTRFEQDVIHRSGVRSVIILEGINDILQGPPTTQSLIDALTTLATTARTAGIHPIGGTILPMKGVGGFDPNREAIRQAVNSWIRTTDVFDAFVDFDAVVDDPDNPGAMRPEYDKGDHLHPGPVGYAAMGGAIDLADLGAYARPGTLKLLTSRTVEHGTQTHLTAQITAASSAQDVRVTFTLPDGWTLSEPAASATVALGSLKEGEVAVASIAVIASTPPSRIDSHIIATASFDGKATSLSEQVRTIAPASVADTTPPVAAVLVSPVRPPSTGWYTREVTITATASDDHDDFLFVEQYIDAGPWTAYVDPIVISAGEHTVAVRSTDAAGNVSLTAHAQVAVDPAAPVVTARLDTQARRVTATASDALSGVKRTEYRGSNGFWYRYTGPLAAGRSAGQYAFRAIDNAGHTSAIVEVDVPAAARSTSVVTITPAPARFGTRATVAVRVSTSDGSVADGGVIVRQDGDIVGVSPLLGGHAAVRLAKKLARGNHAITVHYVGSNSIDASSASATLVVKKAASKVKVKAPRTATAKRARLSVRVTSPGSTAGKAKVRIKNGKRSVVKETVHVKANGKAALRVKRLSQPGTYQVKVRFLGSSTAAKATGKARLKIVR